MRYLTAGCCRRETSPRGTADTPRHPWGSARLARTRWAPTNTTAKPVLLPERRRAAALRLWWVSNKANHRLNGPKCSRRIIYFSLFVLRNQQPGDPALEDPQPLRTPSRAGRGDPDKVGTEPGEAPEGPGARCSGWCCPSWGRAQVSAAQPHSRGHEGRTRYSHSRIV